MMLSDYSPAARDKIYHEFDRKRLESLLKGCIDDIRTIEEFKTAIKEQMYLLDAATYKRTIVLSKAHHSEGKKVEYRVRVVVIPIIRGHDINISAYTELQEFHSNRDEAFQRAVELQAEYDASFKLKFKPSIREINDYYINDAEIDI